MVKLAHRRWNCTLKLGTLPSLTLQYLSYPYHLHDFFLINPAAFSQCRLTESTHTEAGCNLQIKGKLELGLPPDIKQKSL